MVFLEKCPNLTFNVYHGFEGCLLGWDWEQSSLVLITAAIKLRDSFASSMIKEDNRVGSRNCSCIGGLYLIPER